MEETHKHTIKQKKPDKKEYMCIISFIKYKPG